MIIALLTRTFNINHPPPQPAKHPGLNTVPLFPDMLSPWEEVKSLQALGSNGGDSSFKAKRAFKRMMYRKRKREERLTEAVSSHTRSHTRSHMYTGTHSRIHVHIHDYMRAEARRVRHLDKRRRAPAPKPVCESSSSCLNLSSSVQEGSRESKSAHLHTCTLAHLHTCTLAHLHTCTLAHLHTCTLAHLLTCSLAHLLTCSLAHLLTCSLAHLLTRSGLRAGTIKASG